MNWKLVGTLVAGFVLGLGTSLLTSQQPAAQAQPKPARVALEYQVYSTRGKPANEVAADINRHYAAHGWEFVATIEQVNDGAFLLFKRPKN